MFSGAMDVIVVEDKNKNKRSTPFHVRFGSLKILQTKNQYIEIVINKEPTNVKMRLKNGGDAYFDFCDLPEEEDSIKKTYDDEEFEPIQVRDFSKRSSNAIYIKNHFKCPIIVSNSKKDILLDKANAEKIFVKNIIPKEVFQEDPWKVIEQKNTIFLINNILYDAKIAIPIILSQMMYKEEFPNDKINELINKPGLLKQKGKDISNVQIMNMKIMKTIKHKQTNYDDDYKDNRERQTPTTKQLNDLKLNYGRNEIKYVCKTLNIPTAEVNAEIYLWPDDAKLIISDIDGTITKSDILGQVMPMIGGEWTHAGVAKLFTQLDTNNYKILYLTARALCQADLTRDYLRKCNQEKNTLPLGPILMSPDGLFSSFKREVIDKTPDELKKRILTEVRTLFPIDYCPFFSGFGNRPTDVKAYEYMKIHKDKIFIINPKGDITYSDNKKTTYSILHNIANTVFPIILETQKDNQEKDIK